jgi:integrase
MVIAVQVASGRRPRGVGGIVAIPAGMWRVDVEITADPVTGARRRVSRRVRGSRDDAEVALTRLRVADHDGRLLRPGTRARSVGAALKECLHDARIGVVKLAPKTVVTTRSAVATMSKVVLADGRVFGDMSLAQLSWQDIEALFRAMKLAGSGVAWIRRSATVLSRASDRARKHGLIETNPAKDAARPKMVRSKPHSPLKADLVELFAELATLDADIADAAIILAGTGMRMGELLGLQWADVHLGQRQVNVSWAITDGGPGVGVLRKATKRSDWRDVPLTSDAVAAFRRQAEQCSAVFGVTRLVASTCSPGEPGPTCRIVRTRLETGSPTPVVRTRRPSYIFVTMPRHRCSTQARTTAPSPTSLGTARRRCACTTTAARTSTSGAPYRRSSSHERFPLTVAVTR